VQRYVSSCRLASFFYHTSHTQTHTQGFAVLLLGLKKRRCCIRIAFNVWYEKLVQYASRQEETKNENLILKGIAYRSKRMEDLEKEIHRVKCMDVSRVAAVELLREMISKHETKTENRIRDLEKIRNELKFRISGGDNPFYSTSSSSTTRTLRQEQEHEEEKEEHNNKHPPSSPESSKAAMELKERLRLFDLCARKKIESLESEIKRHQAALGVVV